MSRGLSLVMKALLLGAIFWNPLRAFATEASEVPTLNLDGKIQPGSTEQSNLAANYDLCFYPDSPPTVRRSHSTIAFLADIWRIRKVHKNVSEEEPLTLGDNLWKFGLPYLILCLMCIGVYIYGYLTFVRRPIVLHSKQSRRFLFWSRSDPAAVSVLPKSIPSEATKASLYGMSRTVFTCLAVSFIFSIAGLVMLFLAVNENNSARDAFDQSTCTIRGLFNHLTDGYNRTDSPNSQFIGMNKALPLVNTLTEQFNTSLPLLESTLNTTDLVFENINNISLALDSVITTAHAIQIPNPVGSPIACEPCIELAGTANESYVTLPPILTTINDSRTTARTVLADLTPIIFDVHSIVNDVASTVKTYKGISEDVVSTVNYYERILLIGTTILAVGFLFAFLFFAISVYHTKVFTVHKAQFWSQASWSMFTVVVSLSFIIAGVYFCVGLLVAEGCEDLDSLSTNDTISNNRYFRDDSSRAIMKTCLYGDGDIVSALDLHGQLGDARVVQGQLVDVQTSIGPGGDLYTQINDMKVMVADISVTANDQLNQLTSISQTSSGFSSILGIFGGSNNNAALNQKVQQQVAVLKSNLATIQTSLDRLPADVATLHTNLGVLAPLLNVISEGGPADQLKCEWIQQDYRNLDHGFCANLALQLFEACLFVTLGALFGFVNVVTSQTLLRRMKLKAARIAHERNSSVSLPLPTEQQAMMPPALYRRMSDTPAATAATAQRGQGYNLPHGVNVTRAPSKTSLEKGLKEKETVQGSGMTLAVEDTPLADDLTPRSEVRSDIDSEIQEEESSENGGDATPRTK
eukprot:GILJ01010111.1.p1 GENE.GILJ01010111.1~~GILJ01010111.1.p1  ORF type:complete len:806 (-),score=113.32 GILJ01010111.1:44-2461(-)